MRSITRFPDFKVSIVRPAYFSTGYYSETTIYEFGPYFTGESLIGYSYSQDVGSFEAGFSLTFLPVPIGQDGETAIDYFQENDLVKIEEHGEMKYLGVIENLRYSASMEQTADRSISITGFGVGGILERFNLVLDQIILSDAKTALDSINKELVNNLSSKFLVNDSIVMMLETIASSFKRVMAKIGGFKEGLGIWKVVDQYLAFSDDSRKMKLKYPFAGSLFSYGGITLAALWQTCVFKPVQEFFIRWDEKQKKYLLTLRPTPFSKDAWESLRIVTIDPLIVSRCDIGFTSREVKTWFFAYLSGGSVPYEVARAIYQKDAIISPLSDAISNSEKTALGKKWAMYGYNPLEVTFKFGDVGGLAEKNGVLSITQSGIPGDVVPLTTQITDKDLMKFYSKQIYSWYKQSDEMLSGSITIMTMKGGPRIGERTYFHGSQYYIESVSGSWSYGGTMETTLRVTRGGKYNKAFNPDAPETTQNWWFKKATRVGDPIGTTAEEMENGSRRRS